MASPTAAEYSTGVEDPQHNFEDPELQNSVPRINPRQKPWKISGGFATVFSMLHQSAADPTAPTPQDFKFAVRTFTGPITDQRDRYIEIQRHLQKVQVPYTIDFQYQEDGHHAYKGIYVPKNHNAWFPLLRMEWVVGENFGKIVEQNINDPNALLYLAAEFRKMVHVLQSNDIGHLDLQHNNIMVTPGWDLILVDYDAMWVPGIASLPSKEDGIPHFQHPDRKTNPLFDKKIDNFSAIVIYLSLGILAADPGLYQKYNDPGENIIFHNGTLHKDFDSAQSVQRGQSGSLSSIWADIRAIQNPFGSVIHDITNELEKACGLQIDQVPTLEDVIGRAGAFPAKRRPVPMFAQAPAAPPPTGPTTPTTVVQPAQQVPRISLPSTSITFTPTRVGTQPATETFTIQNSGTGDLHLTAVSVVSGPYTVQPLTSTTVTPGGSVTVSINFTPTARGQSSGSVEIRSDDPNNRVLAVALSGRGLAPEISVSWPGQPGAMDFGQIRVGVAAPSSITIKNLGDIDLSNISITGPANNVTVGQCAATLAAGSSQSVALTFTPAAEGNFTDQIIVASDDPALGSLIITLTGEGFIPPPVKKCLRCGDINPQTAARCRCGSYLRNWRNYELLRP